VDHYYLLLFLLLSCVFTINLSTIEMYMHLVYCIDSVGQMSRLAAVLIQHVLVFLTTYPWIGFKLLKRPP